MVDDCSTDDTVAKAGKKGTIVLQSSRQSGPAFIRNLGAQHATGEILLFVDSDIIVQRDTIKKVIDNFLHHHEIADVFGSYDEDPEEKNFISQYKNLFHHYHHQQSDMNASTFWAGCGAIRKKIFEDLGGFNHKRYIKPSIEDIELGNRLREKKYRILLDKNMQVKHLKRWKFLSMVRTDIFQRAIPWSRLILETKFMPKDLNLHISHKISSISIALLLLTIPFLFSGYTKLFGFFSLLLFINILIFSGVSFALCWMRFRISPPF